MSHCTMQAQEDYMFCCEEGAQGYPHSCAASKRACGHHCSCIWVHDACCWCGTEFGEYGEAETEEDRMLSTQGAAVPRSTQ